ncbi:MAG: phage portal protein [Spirochaetaceae bacterium]|nr:phage portal protein [Spirochaetaceae bacterium]
MNNNKLPPAQPTPIDIKNEIERMNRTARRFQNSGYFHPKQDGAQSSFFDEWTVTNNLYGNLKTADGHINREVDCKTLRRVSKKAWIINLCILNVQKKIKPFLKPSTNRNIRGFVVKKIGEDVIKAAGQKSKEREEIERFLLNTGTEKSYDRDNFTRWGLKFVRDALEIDQNATEIGYTRAGKPYAFWAVDGATIEKVLPNQDNPYNIKHVQIINAIPTAYYPEGTLIFDYQNPRTDVNFSFYGYSAVEQAIDLITSCINAFTYNAGFFTENKLPRGMLLLDGNANQETVEQMEDYIADIMSGSVTNQWRVPIIPAGNGKDGEANSIKWISLTGTNKEMEFQNWLDFLTSAIVSLFGCSMEELGLHSSKSQAMFERNTTPEIEASKSLILGDMLSYMQQFINQIVEKAFPGYEIEFVGYERDDPKQILDLTKGELESYKTLNEVRKEKGLKPIEADWADKCPANPQLVQMYQSSQMDGGGMEDPDAAEDGEENTDFGGDFGDEENADGENSDNDAWNGIAGSDKEGNAENEDNAGEEENPEGVEKSLRFEF